MQGGQRQCQLLSSQAGVVAMAIALRPKIATADQVPIKWLSTMQAAAERRPLTKPARTRCTETTQGRTSAITWHVMRIRLGSVNNNNNNNNNRPLGENQTRCAVA